jgi:[acyl-carrier-protein] S-malonyltransferase
MLADVGEARPQICETFGEASDALGYDLWALAQSGLSEQLAKTEVTQPLLLTAGVALMRAWRAAGGSEPTLAAGHSLGEYTALTAFGALPLADAVQLVEARGRFMQHAVAEGVGAMAAVIGLADVTIEEICAAVSADTQTVIDPVNYNAPGQLVIAGHASGIEAVLPKLKAAGAKRALRLPVSAPFHCALMRPAAEQLSERLDATEIQPPSVPVVQNVSLKPESDPAVIRTQLIQQTYSPVRWTQTIDQLNSAGVSWAGEFGPGAVLCGLAKRMPTEIPHRPMATEAQFQETLEQMEGV